MKNVLQMIDLRQCFDKIIVFGFTGTRRGMSDKQKMRIITEFTLVVEAGYEIHAHHGDCIGSDCEFDGIARRFGAKMHIHPPTDTKNQAFCAEPGDVVYPPGKYLVRDEDIVKAAMFMFGAPKDHLVEEFRGSGTWATIRMARDKHKVPHIILERY